MKLDNVRKAVFPDSFLAVREGRLQRRQT